jgi:hydrogenase nickel incorporation protein HypA/HybF
MHEISIISSLIQQIETLLENKPYTKVLTITLEIGTMSGVVPDALEFAYEVCSKGTRVDGAKLAIIPVPVTAKCQTCLAEFCLESYCFSCPHCNNQDLKIISGYELKVKEMEVEGNDREDHEFQVNQD